MEARHREKSQSVGTGTVTFPGKDGPVVSGPSSQVFEFRSMDDYVGKKRRLFDPTGSGLPPSNLDMTIIERSWVPLNGGVNDTVWWFHQFKPSVIGSDGINPLAKPSGKDKGNDAYVLKLLARTNPMRSEYSVPVAIRELVDVTSMFSLAAKTFAGFIGGAYLNYRFGWLAFVNDVKTLAKIVELVNSRVKEFNSLLQAGGVRRSTQLDSFGAHSRGVATIQSAFGVTLQANYQKHTRWKIWGSVRWYPKNINVIPTEAADTWLLAVRQVLDLEEIDSSTMWNLIPWTWLIDYFSNIGDLLAAYEGRNSVVPRDICIMRETTTIDVGQRRPTGTLSDKISGGDYRLARINRTRTVYTNPPSTAQAFDSLLTAGEFKVVLALLAKFAG